MWLTPRRLVLACVRSDGAYTDRPPTGGANRQATAPAAGGGTIRRGAVMRSGNIHQRAAPPAGAPAALAAQPGGSFSSTLPSQANGLNSAVPGISGSAISASGSGSSNAAAASSRDQPSGGHGGGGGGGFNSSGYGGGVFMGGACFHGEEVLHMHADLLSEYERAEIRDVGRVWWDGHTAGKPRGTLLPGEFNHGFDDDRGDYSISMHDHLAYRYEILGIVGKGSFGQVVKAYDHREGRQVAIKIIRNKARFHKQAMVETKVLSHLRDFDPRDETNTIKMLDHFAFRNHLCIVFELLSVNLYEFMKSNSFLGVSIPLIRRFAVQMLNTLRYLQRQSIVHCDLKPENILLCQPGRSAVKVIDFGSSCFEAQPVYTYIQSRFYRAPEVILGLPYFCAIDMWSFGCILAELYTGYPLFPGENEVEQLACMMEVLGPPPPAVVAECGRRKQFFDADGAPRIVANSKGRKRRPASKDLMSCLRCTDVTFISFLEGCLQWSASERFSPEAALKHEWILELAQATNGAAQPGKVSGGGRGAAMAPPNDPRPPTANRSARGGGVGGGSGGGAAAGSLSARGPPRAPPTTRHSHGSQSARVVVGYEAPTGFGRAERLMPLHHGSIHAGR